MIIHDIEWQQTIPTIGYCIKNPKAAFLLEWSDGEAYEAEFFSSWESDNLGELEIDEDDPRFDEFHQCSFDITKIVKDGPRRYHDAITIDYRDFPARITDLTNHVTVYPAQE